MASNRRFGDGVNNSQSFRFISINTLHSARTRATTFVIFVNTHVVINSPNLRELEYRVLHLACKILFELRCDRYMPISVLKIDCCESIAPTEM